MSIASEITRINNNIAGAYTECNSKGATMPVTQNSANLSTTIASIPTGGGGVTDVVEKDVNFYTYDGTRVYSYTAQEFANLSAMPISPTYDLLNSQGWNWTLADAKTYVATMGGLDIGDTAVSKDGTMRIYITLIDDVNLSPVLCLYVNGTITIDWGDNSTPDTETSTFSSFWSKKHTYASKGSYEIKITPEEGTGIVFVSNSNTNYNFSLLIGSAETSSQQTTYQKQAYYNSTITKIIMPNTTYNGFGINALRNCINLQSINVPPSYNMLNSYCFANCNSLKFLSFKELSSSGNYSLMNTYSMKALSLNGRLSGQYAYQNCNAKTVWLPPNIALLDNKIFSNSRFHTLIYPSRITSITQQAFDGATYLVKLKFLGDISSLGSTAFQYCYSLQIIDFSNNTQVPTLPSSSYFSNLPSDFKIIVPDSLYDTWVASWTSYASKIVKASEVS